MTEMLSSAFRELAAALDLQSGNQVTTTNGKIIRLQARRSGHHKKLRLVKRALQAGVDEGLAFINPRVGDNKRHSQFNKPFMISATKKGIEFLAGPDIEEKPWEKLEPQIHLVPNPDEGRPLDRRFKLPTERRLPVPWDPASMTWDRKDKAIMNCLMAICKKAGKPHCYPSRETIIENCLKYSRVKMSLRCLDYHLEKLEAAGYIRIQCRHQKTPYDGWKYHSNLYELCQRAWEWIKKELSRLSKLAATFALQKIATTSIQLNRIIKGSNASNGALPPRLEDKGAAPPPVPPDRQLKPFCLSFNDYLSIVDRQ